LNDEQRFLEQYDPQRQYVLSLPLSESIEERLRDVADDKNCCESLRTLRWLSSDADAHDFRTRLQRAWETLPSCLATLLPTIGHVELSVVWRDVRVRVSCGKKTGAYLQYAPIEPVAMRDVPTPAAPSGPLLRGLACAVPGLAADHCGGLLDVQTLVNPLGNVRDWLSSVYKLQLPDGVAQKLCCEVLVTPLGDSYLLGRDDTVYFFDHEEPELASCSFSLDRLLERHLADPDSTIEPSNLGSVQPFWIPK
jgi:hypothetical protein